jgi:hypothetical protein
MPQDAGDQSRNKRRFKSLAASRGLTNSKIDYAVGSFEVTPGGASSHLPA